MSEGEVASFGFVPGMHAGDVMGHETMGEVVEVGRGNSKLKVGDRVVAPFTISTSWPALHFDFTQLSLRPD
ncbi:threonine dehydrogenase-like Zn-dependent dehydrogenase [Neorhizobium huautlense]|uniref:Threonine dehydrogenase-like Zn-dependent dehydrogenase n=1 Tax=Neorhizobium huautlense TaxID=67774 RepID=A0ABT9PZJ9_9HYPH|nr:threonine dehydrogenase-like Zn-dependent dehydrogenase [Neorhizobium huautlense]